MIVLGVALAVVALLVVVFVGVGGGGTVTLSAFGVDVTASPFVVFLGGAATLLLLLAGLWMIRWGLLRHSRTRAEIQRLRRIEAEVEARQIAELSRDPQTPPPGPVDKNRHDDPVATHHAPASPEHVPAREDGEPRRDPPVDATRPMGPFEKDAGPSGSTAADTVPSDRGDTVVVRDADGERDNNRL